MSLKDLVEKYLKSAIINIAKELKETISKELKKSINRMSHQINDINKEKEMIKKN